MINAYRGFHPAEGYDLMRGCNRIHDQTRYINTIARRCDSH